MGHAKTAQDNIETALGIALLVGAGAMVLRFVLDRRGGHRRTGLVHDVTPRPLATVAIGMIGGLIVGMTSVGSGSLMIVLLLFVYPMIGAKQLVGTDLTQAVPLTLAAALGALAFGHVELAVTASLILGSVPAVLSARCSPRPSPIATSGRRSRSRSSPRGSSTSGSGRPRSVGSCARSCSATSVLWLSTTRPWQTQASARRQPAAGERSDRSRARRGQLRPRLQDRSVRRRVAAAGRLGRDQHRAHSVQVARARRRALTR